MSAALELPGPPDFATAMGAITHERHKRSVATRVRTFRRITLVGVVTSSLFHKAGAVAPRAIIPIIFDTALTARAMGRHTRIGAP